MTVEELIEELLDLDEGLEVRVSLEHRAVSIEETEDLEGTPIVLIR